MADLEIRLAGSGGQGLILGGLILAEALLLEGRQVAQSQSFDPVSRGGVSFADIVASDAAVEFPLPTALDLLVLLDQLGVDPSAALLTPSSTVLMDAQRVGSPPGGGYRRLVLPFTETALALKNPRSANLIALGAVAALGAVCSLDALLQAARSQLPGRLAEAGLAAVHAGAALARNVAPRDDATGQRRPGAPAGSRGA